MMRVYFLWVEVVAALMLVHTANGLGIHCDSPTYRCYCFYNDVDCTEQYLKRIPKFEQMNTTYDSIDFGKNAMSRIQSHAFARINVKHINIWRNRKSMVIEEEAFVDLEDSLEELYIRKSHVTQLPERLFGKMKALRHVDLSLNDIQELHPKGFKGARNLKVLVLQHNKLTVLRSQTFRGLKNLTELWLDENDIHVIDSKAFAGLWELRDLSLSRNKIRDLQPRSFRGLRMLRLMDLSYNNITAIFPQMFRGLDTLEALDLSLNPIMLIADGTFSSMSLLRNLHIKEAKLTSLRPETFKGLEKLRILELQGNYIRFLPDGTFGSIKSLKRINLAANGLESLSPCVFRDIKSVKEMDLSDNCINCDCTMGWAASEQVADVIGSCDSPPMERNKPISSSERYNVCTFTGMECFEDEAEKDNQPLQIWLKYQRAFRHQPKQPAFFPYRIRF